MMPAQCLTFLQDGCHTTVLSVLVSVIFHHMTVSLLPLLNSKWVYISLSSVLFNYFVLLFSQIYSAVYDNMIILFHFCYTQITVTVEQLPDPADGQTYQCVFDDNPPIPTVVSGNQLTCQTPSASRIPSIPSGEGEWLGKLTIVYLMTIHQYQQWYQEINWHVRDLQDLGFQQYKVGAVSD